MSELRAQALITALAIDAGPVTPLAPPGRRSLAALAIIMAAGTVAIALSNVPQLFARYAGREVVMALEMAAMLVTGVLGVVAAFFVSVPGRSRLWSVAPIPFAAAWLILSGLGCYGGLLRGAEAQGSTGDSLHCLAFITGTSLVLAVPLAWRLSRAAPIEATRVALLAGLGSAALSAFLLQFYHPFAVTVLDLAVHLATMLLVVGIMGALGRRVLVRA